MDSCGTTIRDSPLTLTNQGQRTTNVDQSYGKVKGTVHGLAIAFTEIVIWSNGLRFVVTGRLSTTRIIWFAANTVHNRTPVLPSS